MNDADAWVLEERLWLEGLPAFEELLDPGCLMAFPGMGVKRVAAILDGLKGAPRWASVRMTDREASRLGDAVIVLGYTADARRDGAEPYRCFCTSTYRADEGCWKVVQHQQTMAG